MIRSFLKWAYFDERDRWTESNYDEKTLVMRHVSQAKILFGCSFIVNGLFYAAFLTGIYNYRTTELINMRLVPFPLKFGLSTMVGSYFAFTIWNDDIYNPDLYKLAIKYRMQYDGDFKLHYEGTTSASI